MREIKWEDNTDFSFANSTDRENLLCSEDFTFGHYRVGPGYATIGGARIGNRLYYAVTFCSPEDNFSKSEGRMNVADHLCEAEFGHLRGVLQLGETIDDVPPAVVLKQAVEMHLSKMRPDRKPQWAKGAAVDFRSKQRSFGETTDWATPPLTHWPTSKVRG